MGSVLLALALLATPPSQSGCLGTADADLDGLADACELELAARFAPELVVSPTACNWDAEAGLLRGGYMFGAEPVGDGVHLAYLPAYLNDCGWSGPKCLLRWRGGCDPHAADSELILLDLARDMGAAEWRARRVFLSAHCFGGSDGDCRWHQPSELEWHAESPRVWVAEGKNANYRSRAACDSGHWRFDTCDRNDRSYRFPIQSAARSIGSKAVLFRAWAGPTIAGSTGYARYLEEVGGMGAEPAATPAIQRVCEGSDVDPWVSDFRTRVESYDGLYRFAVERFGAPTSCDGEITMELDGASFGVLRFGFEGGRSYSVESMPPETSVALLRAPGGFEDVHALRSMLEAHTAAIGLAIDWSAPEIGEQDGELVHTYWDPGPGLNASASLIFIGDALVGIRVSMAL